MIKGVNKQIIEIKCPNNEHFEKILLFVNSQKETLSGAELDEKAKLTAKRFLTLGRCPGRGDRIVTMLKSHAGVLGFSAGAFMAAVFCAVLLIF